MVLACTVDRGEAAADVDDAAARRQAHRGDGRSRRRVPARRRGPRRRERSVGRVEGGERCARDAVGGREGTARIDHSAADRERVDRGVELRLEPGDDGAARGVDRADARARRRAELRERPAHVDRVARAREREHGAARARVPREQLTGRSVEGRKVAARDLARPGGRAGRPNRRELAAQVHGAVQEQDRVHAPVRLIRRHGLRPHDCRLCGYRPDACQDPQSDERARGAPQPNDRSPHDRAPVNRLPSPRSVYLGSRRLPRGIYVTVATTFVTSGDRPTNGTFTTSTCRPLVVTIVCSCQAAAAWHEPP